jgi:hypothetical protein
VQDFVLELSEPAALLAFALDCLHQPAVRHPTPNSRSDIIDGAFLLDVVETIMIRTLSK